MSGKKPEIVFNVEDLLTDINKAFVQAAIELRTEFQKDAWKDSPFVYHMPKMHLSVQLVLSFSDGQVKGFFSKSSSSEQQELSSKIEIDVVSVPRSETT
jgi:hypothetical protein